MMEVKCLSLMMVLAGTNQIHVNNKVHEFNLSCNWSIIDGACDDPKYK